MAFTFEKTKIPGVMIIQPQVFGDSRGYFMESFKAPDFAAAGLPVNYVQDNESSSTKGVLRGLHFQKNHTQGKLVRVTHGEVFDVAVDVRAGSKTFGQYVAVELSDENHRQLFIPRGFLHGFSVLSDTAVFSYKVDNFYNKQSEWGMRYDAPEFKIDWKVPSDKVITSEKDRIEHSLKDVPSFSL